MNCLKCGANNPADAIYCNKCGSRMERYTAPSHPQKNMESRRRSLIIAAAATLLTLGASVAFFLARSENKPLPDKTCAPPELFLDGKQ